jgi:bifunctional UDP-N-acetylglucosamine pyrophosphorylase/glucosamine-1-phosphate N-acetyltransferase
MTSTLPAIILAAGKGTRMKSPLPKVLHPVAGRPLIERVIKAAREAGSQQIRLVVGHGESLVRQVVEPLNVTCYSQKNPQGTADAVTAADVDSIDGDVVILNGDHPLIQSLDIKNFVREFKEEKCDLAVVTVKLKKPGHYGRIVRQNGELKTIVEAKDASSDTLKIQEVNTGIYVVKSEVLKKYLPQIENNNAQKEYYLTDLIALALEAKLKVRAIRSDSRVAHGVNTQKELAFATKEVFKQKIIQLMDEGVVVIDPRTTYVEAAVQVGAGSVLYPNCFLRGATTIGAFSVIEPNVFISDSKIADSVQIRAGSYLEQVQVQAKCTVGPYARLRPGTHLMEEAHVGNFVELKNVQFGKKSKAGHLTYLGDADIGEEVNIGCGTITCNYAADRKKYRTKIGDRVFVGSDTQFVAPVEIGADAVIGSGSTITKSVPAKALAVARGKQFIKENYVAKKTTT